MADQLTLKRTDPDHDSYVTLYEHPSLGKFELVASGGDQAIRTAPLDWTWAIQQRARTDAVNSGYVRCGSIARLPRLRPRKTWHAK